MQEQVIAMAEVEQNFRPGIVRADSARKDRGQWLGFAVFVIGLGASVALALTAHDAVAEIIGGTTIGGSVSVFVAGRVLGGNPEASDVELAG